MKKLLVCLAALPLLCLSAAAASVTVTGTLCGGSTATVTLNRYSAAGSLMSTGGPSVYVSGSYADSLQDASDGSRYEASITCPGAAAAKQYWLIPAVASATLTQVSVASALVVPSAGYYWDSTNSAWKHTSAGISGGTGGGASLPTQTGHSGEFLTTNGTAASWAAVSTARVIEHIAGISQEGAPGSGFSWVATANAFPTPAAVTGTNAVGGVLQFSDSYTQSVQQRFYLSGTTVSADIFWRANVANASKNVVWQLYTACVAAGEDGDPSSWNPVQVATSAAHGTAYRWRKATISPVTVTGCASGEVMRYKLLRDPTHVNDDLGAAAELISVVWTVQ